MNVLDVLAAIVIGFETFWPLPQADAQEYSQAAQDADDDLCADAKAIISIAVELKRERGIEATSGVKNLRKMRALGEAWDNQMRNFARSVDAQQKAKGRVKNFTAHCEGISASDEQVFDDELARAMSAAKSQKGAK